MPRFGGGAWLILGALGAWCFMLGVLGLVMGLLWVLRTFAQPIGFVLYLGAVALVAYPIIRILGAWGASRH